MESLGSPGETDEKQKDPTEDSWIQVGKFSPTNINQGCTIPCIAPCAHELIVLQECISIGKKGKMPIAADTKRRELMFAKIIFLTVFFSK